MVSTLFGFKIEDHIDEEIEPVSCINEKITDKDLETTAKYLATLEDKSLLNHLKLFYHKTNQLIGR